MDIKAANISWVPGIKSWIGYRAEDIEEEFRAVKILEKYGIHYEEGKFDTYYVDADVADQIVQYAMFKEVVYG